jgi:hypothetical protein
MEDAGKSSPHQFPEGDIHGRHFSVSESAVEVKEHGGACGGNRGPHSLEDCAEVVRRVGKASALEALVGGRGQGQRLADLVTKGEREPHVLLRVRQWELAKHHTLKTRRKSAA